MQHSNVDVEANTHDLPGSRANFAPWASIWGAAHPRNKFLRIDRTAHLHQGAIFHDLCVCE